MGGRVLVPDEVDVLFVETKTLHVVYIMSTIVGISDKTLEIQGPDNLVRGKTIKQSIEALQNRPHLQL